MIRFFYPLLLVTLLFSSDVAGVSKNDEAAFKVRGKKHLVETPKKNLNVRHSTNSDKQIVRDLKLGKGELGGIFAFKDEEVVPQEATSSEISVSVDEDVFFLFFIFILFFQLLGLYSSTTSAPVASPTVSP